MSFEQGEIPAPANARSNTQKQVKKRPYVRPSIEKRCSVRKVTLFTGGGAAGGGISSSS